MLKIINKEGDLDISENFNNHSFDNFLDLFNNLFLDDNQNKPFFKKNYNDNNKPHISNNQIIEEIKNEKY